MISEEEHKQMPEPVRERLEALKDAPGSVIVVGSMNADYTVTTKRLPKPGETVNGGAMKVLPGGKGANQASAAARLGVNVQLLGAVGEDSNADFLLGKLDEAGVDTADILHVEGPSGTTVITVSAEGENTIVYSPGSNAKASAGYVQSHRTTMLAGLAAGHTLLQSAQIGSYVSAYAATKLGAQSVYGTAEEVIAYFS